MLQFQTMIQTITFNPAKQTLHLAPLVNTTNYPEPTLHLETLETAPKVMIVPW